MTYFIMTSLLPSVADFHPQACDHCDDENGMLHLMMIPIDRFRTHLFNPAHIILHYQNASIVLLED